jgi:hypothetical protein
VNFIGHATVALWSNRHPLYVLGAMLPDFAGMAGIRLSSLSGEGPLSQGVALHHRTDDAFHGAPGFLELMGQAMSALTEGGVPRGPARAVAHVGVELLIDGDLVQSDEVARAYLEALEHDQHVRELLPDPQHLQRWITFARRLRSYGVPYDYRNTEAVVMRLSRILAGRPRLALDAASERVVRGVLPDLQHKVAQRLPELLTHVRTELAA